MGLRVAYLTHYADLYGANRSLLELITASRSRHGVVPFVLAPKEGPFTQRLAAENIPFRIIAWEPWLSERRYMGRPHHRIGQYLRYERAARRHARRDRELVPVVLEQLRAWQVDLVHVNSVAVGITPALVGKLSVPLLWQVREMPERHYAMHLDAGVRGYIRALRGADRVVAISQAVRADIHRRTGPGLRVDVVYNGVLSEQDYRKLEGTAEERWRNMRPFTFLMAGVIHPGKGQDEAVRALARVHREFPDVRLRIAGGGKADDLRRTIQEFQLQGAVEILGYVDDLSDFYRSGHAFLMCSRHEAMGRVTVEAMGHGLPVIGHAEGGTTELVDHGVTGLLYADGAEELAQRMVELVRDPEKARGLGVAAMRQASERFTIERCAEQVMTIYQELLARRVP